MPIPDVTNRHRLTVSSRRDALDERLQTAATGCHRFTRSVRSAIVCSLRHSDSIQSPAPTKMCSVPGGQCTKSHARRRRSSPSMSKRHSPLGDLGDLLQLPARGAHAHDGCDRVADRLRVDDGLVPVITPVRSSRCPRSATAGGDKLMRRPSSAVVSRPSASSLAQLGDGANRPSRRGDAGRRGRAKALLRWGGNAVS